ncbi:hypothetical protein [Alicyclobacillus ferrooxydans]|uniref:Uncharacterized protein n=1 Tax=Alicyclobacillus ferrooxydans TaxID=471514 RepID=A0A0P9CMB4_9BACL|nr:hypothetical protein [Alicyclobacillus ferrooxydans]KPV44096.1 hypothetical protein AN477_08440 [Alicyclobacillus ferrooxydans]
MNAQLNPFDYNHGRPPSHLEESLHSEFNVLPMTIEALQPDVVLFLTGYTYDERIVKTFLNQRLLGDTLHFIRLTDLITISWSDFPMKFFRITRIAHIIQATHCYIGRRRLSL